jgi:hypothetical protein
MPRKADRVDCSDLNQEFFHALRAGDGFDTVANRYAERCLAELAAKRTSKRGRKSVKRRR